MTESVLKGMNVYICTLKPRNSDDQKVVSLVGAPDADAARKLIRGTSAVEDKDILVILLPKVSYDSQEPAVIRKI